jgi:hypothetical protein
MTRSDLYKAILPKLIDYLHVNNLITDVENTNIEDDIAWTRYEDACTKLMAYPNVLAFKKIIKGFNDGIDDNNEIENPLPVRHHVSSEENRNRLMNFHYSSSTLCVLPVKAIISAINDNSYADLENNCWRIIDQILLAYKDNNLELQFLWECCRGQHDNEYYLLTSEPDIPERNWRLYSYSYYCFVNKNRMKMPEELKFTENKEFVSNIAYNADNKYEQYFDVYNVMSESKYSTDILTRYLRMYQILEYLGYRKSLADMTKGNIRENGFVRNVISKASKWGDKEFDELKKGLSGSFPLATIISPTDFTPSQNTFIKDKLFIKNTNHDDAKIWDLVYRLRNCIVHNKESELHFTFANTSVYKDGIEIMKLLINKLEPAIVSVINDHNNDKFDFNEQKIQLY